MSDEQPSDQRRRDIPVKEERKVKSVRLSDVELEQVRLLLQHLRYFDSEHSLLVNAVRKGLLLVATEDNRPGSQQYGGMEIDDLAAQLNMALLPALHFLAEHNKLPTIFRQAVVEPSHPSIPIGGTTISALRSVEPLFDDEAAEEIDHFGTGLMDD